MHCIRKAVLPPFSGLEPDTLDEDVKAEIQKKLAQTIKVNARPLTGKEWGSLLIAGDGSHYRR